METDETWWKKTKKILEKRYPFIVNDLENIDIEFEWCRTERNEINLKKKDRSNVYLHAQSGALIEAQKILRDEVNLVSKFSTIFIYGIGLGYFYDALREWLHEFPDRQLVFFETDLTLFKALCMVETGYKILNDHKVALAYISDQRKISEAVKETVLISLGFPVKKKIMNFTALPYHQLFQKENYREIRGKTYGYEEMLYISAEALRDDSIIHENIFGNLVSLSNAYNGKTLINLFQGLPAIICGGGPSLGKELEILKTMKQQAVIIGAGAGANILGYHHIRPHLCVGLDPNLIQYARFLTQNLYEVPLFFFNRLHRECIKSWEGPLVYIGTKHNNPIKWIEEELGSLVDEDFFGGFSVANFGVALAKLLGCDPIVTLGIDLSKRKNQGYSSGVITHPVVGKAKAKMEIERIPFTRSHMGDSESTTTMQFLQEARWFSTFREKFPQTRFINASIGGMEIEGFEELSLSELKNQINTLPKDIENELDAAIFSLKQFSYEKIFLKLREWKDILIKIREESGNLIEVLLTSKEIAISAVAIKENIEAKLDSYELFKEVRNFYDLYLQAKDRWQGIQENVEDLTSLFSLFTEKCSKRIEIIERCFAMRSRSEKLDWQFLPFENGVAEVELPELPDIMNIGVSKYQYTPSGQVKSLQHYHDNKLQGPSLYFHENQGLLSVGNYNSGKREGPFLYYYPSGALRAIQLYKEGELDGLQSYFYESGAIKTKVFYVSGVLHGDLWVYHLNGNLKKEMHFSEGKREHYERLWDEKGILRLQCEWKNDKPIHLGRYWNSQGGLIVEVDFGDGTGVALPRRWVKDSDDMAQIEHIRSGILDIELHTQELLQQLSDISWEQEEDPILKEMQEELSQNLEHLKEIESRLKKSHLG
ncbi:MAG: hypothetical protein Tsb0021_15010 [Chlamydiales bacterium]